MFVLKETLFGNFIFQQEMANVLICLMKLRFTGGVPISFSFTLCITGCVIKIKSQ